MRGFQTYKACVLLFLFAVILGYAIPARAQAGRRPKGGSSPTASPSPPPESTPVEKKSERPPPRRLLVAIEAVDPMMNVPFTIVEAVLEECTRRLNKPGVKIIIASTIGPGLTPSDAKQQSRKETEQYVVLLKVSSDQLQYSGRQPNSGPTDLFVGYTIFEPGSGKIRQSGRSHVRGSARSDYYLREAANQVAEMILASFYIKLD